MTPDQINYSALGQWASFLVGAVLMAGNCTWVVMALVVLLHARGMEK